LVIINVSGTLNATGDIVANGEDRAACNDYDEGGAGSGGSVYIRTQTFEGSGNIRADGGNAYGNFEGGGGAGGRIAVYYDTYGFTGSVMARGMEGYNYGGAGTIYLKQSGETYGGLIVNNYARTTGITNITSSHTFDWANLTNATVRGASLTIGDTLDVLPGTLYLDGDVVQGTGLVNVRDGAVLSHSGNSSGKSYSLNITCGNLTVYSGGLINVTGKGYAGGTGTEGMVAGPEEVKGTAPTEEPGEGTEGSEGTGRIPGPRRPEVRHTVQSRSPWIWGAGEGREI